MTSETNRTEDWNQSMVKCEAISKLIPNLADSIQKIRRLAQPFEHNKHLQNAEQVLRKLDTVKHAKSTEEKASFVDGYRNHLIEGIEQLTQFFDGLKNELESMSEKSQGEFGRLSANIFLTQESIINIAEQ